MPAPIPGPAAGAVDEERGCQGNRPPEAGLGPRAEAMGFGRVQDRPPGAARTLSFSAAGRFLRQGWLRLGCRAQGSGF